MPSSLTIPLALPSSLLLSPLLPYITHTQFSIYLLPKEAISKYHFDLVVKDIISLASQLLQKH